MTDPVWRTPVAAADDGRADRIAQLRVGGFVTAVLALVGALLGLVWELSSPPGPLGAVLPGGIQADESEAFVAGDGRFALITVVVGLLAGASAWQLRRVRGPYLAVMLAVGSTVGAAMTELVGWAVRGDFDGDAKIGTTIAHLPLTVHMHALLFAEATAAMLVYSLFVAFAVSDDLGRPDFGRAAQLAAPAEGPPAPIGAAAPPSVGPQDGPQYGWRDGDAPGAP